MTAKEKWDPKSRDDEPQHPLVLAADAVRAGFGPTDQLCGLSYGVVYSWGCRENTHEDGGLVL